MSAIQTNMEIKKEIIDRWNEIEKSRKETLSQLIKNTKRMLKGVEQVKCSADYCKSVRNHIYRDTLSSEYFLSVDGMGDLTYNLLTQKGIAPELYDEYYNAVKKVYDDADKDLSIIKNTQTYRNYDRAAKEKIYRIEKIKLEEKLNAKYEEIKADIQKNHPEVEYSNNSDTVMMYVYALGIAARSQVITMNIEQGLDPNNKVTATTKKGIEAEKKEMEEREDRLNTASNMELIPNKTMTKINNITKDRGGM